MLLKRELIVKILDYYEFLLREDEKQMLKHTGTPSFHLLIRNKMESKGEYKQIPHGKGGCILTLGLEEKVFECDELYNLLVPVLGDDEILRRFELKQKAEEELLKKREEYIKSKDIILIESILEARAEDLVKILEGRGLKGYISKVKEYSDPLKEVRGEEIGGDGYIYLLHEGRAGSKITYMVLLKKAKEKEDVLIDIFDYYAYLDGIIGENKQKHMRGKVEDEY